MTTTRINEITLGILADLAIDMPAARRYQRLLEALGDAFPCDAAALLKLQGADLVPVAIRGLTRDTAGRRFAISDQPRLARIMLSREPVRFSADSELPDPYDGLLEDMQHSLYVHDCMGASLYIDDVPWGVLTLDALQPGVFDNIDALELRTFLRLSEASIRIAELIDRLQERAERGHQLASAVIAEQARVSLQGNSAAMKQLQQHIDVVAGSDLPVLISGETGTGKELVARHIHASSARSSFPLVYINCAALPEHLVESELFGHTPGAFSGALQARAGKFELAANGTLFLDEIGEMPLAMQPKLLRALQSGEIQRVGSDELLKADVRIIAATNRDLSAEVAAGRFRADLYHRLSGYPIKVPPLRERGQDVLMLAGHFMEVERRRFGLSSTGIASVRMDKEARDALMAYEWPGNVRELEYLVSRAMLRARARWSAAAGSRSVLSVGLTDLDLPMTQKVLPRSESSGPDRRGIDKLIMQDIGNGRAEEGETALTLRDATDRFQQQLLQHTLVCCHGNQAKAARILGLDRGNFSRLLKRLHIDPHHISTGDKL